MHPVVEASAFDVADHVVDCLQSDRGTRSRIRKVVAAARVARLVRELGHLAAQLDPLGSAPPGDPGLELATHGLETSDLAALPPTASTGSVDGSSQAAQLVQAMAGFGSGAADTSNAVSLAAETPQQPFLTTPQHA